MSLTAAQILAVVDRKVVIVPVPEWGDGATVYVRSLSTAEAIQLSAELNGVTDSKVFMTAQLAAFLSDEAGDQLFKTTADAEPLLERNIKVLNRIIDFGTKLSRTGSLEDEKAK